MYKIFPSVKSFSFYGDFDLYDKSKLLDHDISSMMKDKTLLKLDFLGKFAKKGGGCSWFSVL